MLKLFVSSTMNINSNSEIHSKYYFSITFTIVKMYVSIMQQQH